MMENFIIWSFREKTKDLKHRFLSEDVIKEQNLIFKLERQLKNSYFRFDKVN